MSIRHTIEGDQPQKDQAARLMRIAKALSTTSLYASPEQLDVFRKHIPEEWVEEAIAQQETTVRLRRRRLPGVQVLWLVIGMALFRNEAIHEVLSKLELALPDGKRREVAKGAIPGGRARLGTAPMEWLFTRTGTEWARRSADAHRWQGLALYGIDGSTLRVADSPENRAEFGGQSAGKDKGDSGYPLVRLVTLMALRSHLVASAQFGAYKGTSEVAFAAKILPSIPDDSLTILDRGFLGAPTLVPLASNGTNRHWLTRAKKNTRFKVIKELGTGDALVEMRVQKVSRDRDPSIPKRWTVRAIAYQRPGHDPHFLLTSLLDAERYPAAEIIALYHERWELELAYDEVKTEMLEREETIRSLSPDAVRQELWGILLAFNLVRLEMEAVAKEAGVEPTRISFVMALNLVRQALTWGLVTSSIGVIPRRLRDLGANIARYVLPKRRSDRSYPRAVKIKMSNYTRKRPASSGNPPSAAPGTKEPLN